MAVYVPKQPWPLDEWIEALLETAPLSIPFRERNPKKPRWVTPHLVAEPAMHHRSAFEPESTHMVLGRARYVWSFGFLGRRVLGVGSGWSDRATSSSTRSNDSHKALKLFCFI